MKKLVCFLFLIVLGFNRSFAGDWQELVNCNLERATQSQLIGTDLYLYAATSNGQASITHVDLTTNSFLTEYGSILFAFNKKFGDYYYRSGIDVTNVFGIIQRASANADQWQNYFIAPHEIACANLHVDEFGNSVVVGLNSFSYKAYLAYSTNNAESFESVDVSARNAFLSVAKNNDFYLIGTSDSKLLKFDIETLAIEELYQINVVKA